MTSLAEQIHLRRRAKGMTLTELAAKTGINRNTISRIENGDILSTKLDTLLAICRVLEADLMTNIQPWENVIDIAYRPAAMGKEQG